MKKELNDAALSEIVGGTVIMSVDYNNIGFTSTGEMFDLNVDYYEARDYVEQLKRDNRNMSNTAFDSFCKEKLQEKGWI